MSGLFDFHGEFQYFCVGLMLDGILKTMSGYLSCKQKYYACFS